MKTFKDQIRDLENTRAANVARMSELIGKSLADGRTTEDAEGDEFDSLGTSVKRIDEDLVRLKSLDALNVSQATPAAGSSPGEASQSRGGYVAAPGGTASAVTLRSGSIRVDRNLPKGTAFTRYAMALAVGKGSAADALAFAEAQKSWQDQTPEVASYIKAAAGTSVAGNWAAPLVDPANMVGEFLELLMPKTVIGRINGFQRVPFNIKMLVQTAGSTFGWVGETNPKPVGELAFGSVTMPHHKVAGIVVLSDELVRDSRLSAEQKVRDDLLKQGVKFLDMQFLDPAITATADRPASITNGVTPIAANGTTAESVYYDLSQLLGPLYDADADVDGIALVMRPGMAGKIGLLRNALGQFEFASINAKGGDLLGHQIVTSNSAPAGLIVALSPNEILLADDGEMRLDASREATLDMTGGATPNFSLWQRNAVGIRAERGITWLKARANAVSVISAAAYGPADPTP